MEIRLQKKMLMLAWPLGGKQKDGLRGKGQSQDKLVLSGFASDPSVDRIKVLGKGSQKTKCVYILLNNRRVASLRWQKING
ncbi:MAG: hypothetical protein CM1200mP16_10460 [Nitrospina sp.]|nr:MAG: hypothetical protein CM1200mP16_10460 [Nitrospina sp.]